MIRANELRVGNLVSHYGEIITVDGMDDIDVFNANSGDIPLHSISPIPITPEWLEKFGFEKQNNGLYYEKDGIGFLTGYAIDGTFLIFNTFGARHVHFYFVHQLQNLFFLITNQELELK